jgi:hypothetical protein
MIAGMFIGFAIAVMAGAIGHFQGYLMGVKVRNVTELFASPPTPTTNKCECTHTKNTHSGRGTGSCDVSTRPGYTCACKFFVPIIEKPKKVKAGELDL